MARRSDVDRYAPSGTRTRANVSTRSVDERLAGRERGPNLSAGGPRTDRPGPQTLDRDAAEVERSAARPGAAGGGADVPRRRPQTVPGAVRRRRPAKDGGVELYARATGPDQHPHSRRGLDARLRADVGPQCPGQ